MLEEIGTPRNSDRQFKFVNTMGKTILTPLEQKPKVTSSNCAEAPWRVTPVQQTSVHITVEQMIEVESPIDPINYLSTSQPRQPQLSQMYPPNSHQMLGPGV